MAPIPPVPEPEQDQGDPIMVNDFDKEPKVIDPSSWLFFYKHVEYFWRIIIWYAVLEKCLGIMPSI